MGKWIRMVYVIDAWLLPVAIVVQVFFVGLSLLFEQAFWSIYQVGPGYVSYARCEQRDNHRFGEPN
jgi:hypothetical protein